MRTYLFIAALGLWLLFTLAPHHAGAQPPPPRLEPHEDALIAPPPPATLDGAGSRGPSQYLAGHIAVRLLLPESVSAGENWSQAQIDLIRSEVQAGLDWWAARLPGANLRFSLRLQVVPSAYEPINYGLANEGLWISDLLGRLGFSGGSYFDQAYVADLALRDELGADWATTIFVVNSQRLDGGAFPDGRFAYAYINGPFMVLTSDVGPYGATQMAPVVAHELGHIFGALDQYAAAGVGCAHTSGYLNTPTTNSQYNACGTNLPSIMRELPGPFSQGQVDPSALAQLGYRDSDGDGLIDPLDTTPRVSLYPPLVPLADSRPTLSGQSVDLPFPAPIQQSVSINRISAVEYRVGGGPWLPTSPADGAFDSGDEQFVAALPLYDGVHTVEVRARNSAGNWSPTAATTIAVSQVGAPPAYRPSLPSFTAQTEVQLQLGAPADTQAVQISADPSFAGVAWQPWQASLPFTLAAGDGLHTVYVRFRDGAGRDSLPFALAVTLDTTPPAGQVLRDPQRPDRLLLTAHDAGAGVAEVGLQIDGNAPLWMPYRADIDLASLSSPADTARRPDRADMRILFRDGAGNTSSPYAIAHIYTTYLPLVVR